MRAGETETTKLCPALRDDAFRTSERALNKACGDFEAMVLKQLLDTGSSGAFFGTETGSSLVRHLHSTNLAQAVADGGGIGVADMLKTTLEAALKREMTQPAGGSQRCRLST